MAAALTEVDLIRSAVAARLSGDATLMAMTVMVNGAARALQGVFYKSVPQETDNPYPNIIHNYVTLDAVPASRMRPNGPYRRHVPLLWDVAIEAQDVEPEALAAMLAQVDFLLEGYSVTVIGGRVFRIVYVEPFEIRIDRGTYIYTKSGITYSISAQVS